MKKRFIQLILFACLGAYTITSFAAVPTQQLQFQAAEKAFKKKDYNTFLTLKTQLKQYSLYPYLEYMDLKRKMRIQDKKRVTDFLQRYPHSPLAYRIQNEWLRTLVRRGLWTEFLNTHQQSFQNEKLVDFQCYQAYANYKTGHITEAFQHAETLWMVGHSQHSACNAVFKVWQKSGGITQEKRWQRFKLSMLRGKKGQKFAKQLIKQMDKSHQKWAHLWFKMAKNPHLAYQNKQLQGNDHRAADILLYTLKKTARKNVKEALKHWQALPATHQFSDNERQQAEKILATYMAYQKHPSALHQMAKIHDPHIMDKPFRILRLRTALGQESWPHVLRWIDDLPPEEYQEHVWQYWQARALEQLNHADEAQTIYQKLSQKRDYYGFLAADRIGAEYSYEAHFVPDDRSLQKDIQALPTVQRIFELMALGRRTDAHREWWYLINHQLDQPHAEQAAKLAHDMGWFHRAIMTMSWIKSWDDLNIRFPLEHKSFVLKEAQAKSLDPAWVYGVIRQESAFWVEARSSAGALGLMQLMPGTAKHIAKTLKVRSPSKRQLFTPKVNIHMGTQYLRMMLDKLENHPVLATAAYNAGPHRALKWLPTNKNIDADIWVELIPFTETRRYVRHVMAYTVIYQHRLGQGSHRLSQHMKPITSMVQDNKMIQVAQH